MNYIDNRKKSTRNLTEREHSIRIIVFMGMLLNILQSKQLKK